MSVTLRHIRIFVTVCKLGSTTKAGEELFIAQPSISLAISELENYYGIKLFDRIGRRLHITDVGRRFLQYATHINNLFDDMEKEMKNIDGIGVINIGTSITIGNYLLPTLVNEFKDKNSKMEVNVIVDNTDKIEQLILDNEIDIGLIEGIAHNPYIKQIKFRDDELVAICSNKHRFANKKNIKIENLKNESFILREMGSAGREIFDSIMISKEIEIKPVWQSVSTQAIVRAVSEGIGISVLPYLLVKEAISNDEISVFQISEVSFKRSFYIIYHKNKYLTQSMKDLIELCK